ncbi:MAG: serine/threonine-protein phosphatase [Thermoleophilia bacterium]|nr:serine/threonine-protein phosphatase [Thermoleophilia bacterium]
MQIDLVVLKTAKYGVSEGGDTVEVVERPAGGLTAVMVDGQGSGPAAKNISSSVATKAAGLIAEGVRDGAAARAVHDYLRTHRRAKVQASLTIISADLAERTLVTSRNSPCPVLVVGPEGQVTIEDVEALTIGVHRMVRPVVTQHPLLPCGGAVTFTDGVLNAGKRLASALDLDRLVNLVEANWLEGARATAHAVLEAALGAYEGPPGDDVTVVVLKIAADGDRTVREMHVTYPLAGFPGEGAR